VLRLQIVVQTRIDERGTDGHVGKALGQFSKVMNRFERVLMRQLQSGRKWTGDLAVSLYKEFGISAKLAESAYASLQGKLKSAKELAKLNAVELAEKIDRKQKQIDKKTKDLGKRRTELTKALDQFVKLEIKVLSLKVKLSTAKPARQAKALQRYKSELGKLHSTRDKICGLRAQIDRLKADLHQHKRYVENLRPKFRRAKNRADNPTICFGTKKLFKAQFNLAANGFASHAEWLTAWQAARSSTFIIEGLASDPEGNEFAKLSRQENGTFDLALRLPEALKELADQTKVILKKQFHLLHIGGLTFQHNVKELQKALAGNAPVSVRFHRDETSWRVIVGFGQETAVVREDYSSGIIGVDLNAGFVSVARTDRHGNVVETFDIPMVTHGKSEGQSKTIVEQVAANIIAYAKVHELPVVTEKLDFASKKKQLKDKGGPRYARMLSSFVYSAFDAALASACARSGIYHARVNPAYTSIIGRTKFAARYGLTVHAAAALAIARRALKLSERLPLSFKERVVTLPLNDSHQVTLELPDRKESGQQQTDRPRHVWSDWNEVSKAFRKAVVPRRPSRRKHLSRSILGRNDLHSMVCRRLKDVPKAKSQSSYPRVGNGAVNG
jgi:IS605 OrfB family transposase